MSESSEPSPSAELSPSAVRKEIVSAMVQVLRHGNDDKKVEAAQILLELKAILTQK